jgi:multisubunit Na+/H+ antiporter MnhE subunit
VRRIARLAAWWLGLFGFWLLLVGTSESLELVAGACAATLGAALEEGLHSKLAFDASLLAGAWRIPWRILRDFGLVTWALALHVTGVRPVRSSWVEVPFPRADEPGRRSVAAALGSVSPNAIVAEVDRKRNVAFVHELVPGSGSPTVP